MPSSLGPNYRPLQTISFLSVGGALTLGSRALNVENLINRVPGCIRFVTTANQSITVIAGDCFKSASSVSTISEFYPGLVSLAASGLFTVNCNAYLTIVWESRMSGLTTAQSRTTFFTVTQPASIDSGVVCRVDGYNGTTLPSQNNTLSKYFRVGDTFACSANSGGSISWNFPSGNSLSITINFVDQTTAVGLAASY